jgi:hypothetical protein
MGYYMHGAFKSKIKIKINLNYFIKIRILDKEFIELYEKRKENWKQVCVLKTP